MATYINPQSAFIDTYKSLGFIGFGPGGNSDLQFANGTSSENILAVTNAAQSFDWTPGTPAGGTPMIQSFKNALFNDSSFSFIAQAQIQIFIGGLLIANLNNVTAVQSFWAGMKANNSDPTLAWLTSDVITKVEGYATQYNIPLV